MNLYIGKHASCLGSAGPAGFVAAWHRVWGIFHQVRATNVALVWCPDTQGVSRMRQFFPGVSYIDWIAVDGYDYHRTGSLTFTGIFTPWYSTYAHYGKPLMIAETGALGALPGFLPHQHPVSLALRVSPDQGHRVLRCSRWW